MFTTLPNGTISLDFAVCKRKARKMTAEALRWSIQDCQEAIQAMPTNPKSGAYADEIHVYAAELGKR